MRILVVTSGWEAEIVGGIKRYLSEILPRLEARGHQVLVISSSRHRAGFMRYHGVPVRYIYYKGGFMTLLTVPKKLFWIIVYSARFRPDVVFAQKPANALYTPFLRLLRIPVLCHVHGIYRFVEAHLGKTLEHYKRRDLAKYLIALFGGPIEKFAMQQCKALITFSRFHAAHLAAIDRIHPPKIHVVPNGVDMEAFKPSNPPSALRGRYGVEGMTIGYCGRIVYLKGIDTLLKALAIVKKRYERVRLLLVGDFPEHPEGHWREMVKGLGLEGNVVFVGGLKDDELPGAYRSFDIYCQLTAPVYGFEIAICEAMASGIPVVASDAEERREIYSDAYLPCQWQDAESTASTIMRLLESPDLRRTLAQKALSAVAQYDWERITDQLERVLWEVAQHPKAQLHPSPLQNTA